MTNLEIQLIAMPLRQLANYIDNNWKHYLQQIKSMCALKHQNFDISKEIDDFLNRDEVQKLFTHIHDNLLCYAWENNHKAENQNIIYYDSYVANDTTVITTGLYDNINRAISYYKSINMDIISSWLLYFNGQDNNREYRLITKILNTHDNLLYELQSMLHITEIVAFLSDNIYKDVLKIPICYLNTSTYNIYKSNIINLMYNENYIFDEALNCYFKCGICNSEPDTSKKFVELSCFTKETITDTTINNNSTTDNVSQSNNNDIYKSIKIWVQFKNDLGPCKTPTLNINDTGDFPIYIKYENEIKVGSKIRYIPAGVYPCYFQNTKWVITNVDTILPK